MWTKKSNQSNELGYFDLQVREEFLPDGVEIEFNYNSVVSTRILKINGVKIAKGVMINLRNTVEWYTKDPIYQEKVINLLRKASEEEKRHDELLIKKDEENKAKKANTALSKFFNSN